LLIAYDGSAAARAAIAAAGALMPGATATVLTVHGVPAPERLAQRPGAASRLAELARAVAEEASATAAEGSALATTAGLEAAPATAGTGRRALARDRGLRRAARGRPDRLRDQRPGRSLQSRPRLHLVGSAPPRRASDAGRPEEAADLSGPIVLAYDGSASSRAAIAAAGRLLPGREAIVAHVWESAVRHTLSGRALASAPLPELRELTSDVDEFYAEVAAEIADEGAALAREHGLTARGQAVEAEGVAWRGLMSAARTAGAAAIVAGAGDAVSGLLGSVSAGLVHNAETPVLVAGG
jgi:nucleotide-binding universal stress UspA family protein